MSNNKKIEDVAFATALFPLLIMGMIYIGGLILAVPVGFTFISEMNAPFLIEGIGYIAYIAMLIYFSCLYFRMVVQVTLNLLENNDD